MDGIEAARMVEALSGEARAAARALAGASTAAKDAALRAAAARLRREEAAILRANADDVARARAAGESAAFVDRLALTTSRIDAMARGLEEIAPPRSRGRDDRRLAAAERPRDRAGAR